MSTVFQFARDNPRLCVLIVLASIFTPIILEFIDLVLRIQAALGR